MNNNEKILQYLSRQRVVALATSDSNGVLHSAAVYIYAKEPKVWFVVSKQDTKKARNLTKQPRFSAVTYDRQDNSTLQARGVATNEEDPDVIGDVMSAMAKIYGTGHDWLPPIAKIRAGEYVVVRLDIEWLRFAHFGGASAGSEDIFLEL